MGDVICAVCMAVGKAAGTVLTEPSRVVTMYGGTAYCLEHLCHVDEAVGEIRRAREHRTVVDGTVG